METHSYWQKQQSKAPLFPDIEWNKPERKDQAGRLGVIGGNKLGFAGVAESYQCAQEAGVGAIKVLLPDTLKRTVPASITDALFAPSNPSGSLARQALPEMSAIGAWADGVLLAGDAGRNSETALVYDDFLQHYSGPLTITRDAVDLIKNNSAMLIERPNTLYVVSFAQLQKLFQSVYYPKMLAFSMQLARVVEAVHAFTITHPLTIITLHREHIIIAHEGKVITQEWNNPMLIWRGVTAAKAASYWLWAPTKPLEAVAASLCS